MASFFNVTLDTTAPAGVAVSFVEGATTPDQSVSVNITTTDGVTTGYEMLVWGDIDGGPATEGEAVWQALSSPLPVTLTAGDGAKRVNARIRDDVGNTSGIAFADITLDTAAPVVTVGAPSRTRVSKVAGENVVSNSFTASADYEEFRVTVAPAEGSTLAQSTLIPTTNGSTNTSGSAGGYSGAVAQNFDINAADLETASPGDGAKIIKVFVRDDAGNWSN